jgi:hypothetical protein
MSDEDELQYIAGRRSDMFYYSRPFKDDPRARYAYDKFDAAERSTPHWIRDELVLKTERAGQQQLKALFYTDMRKIDTLCLQWAATKNGKPGVRTFSLQGDEIDRLLKFVMFIKTAKLTADGARFSMADFETYDVSPELFLKLAQRDPKLLAEIAERDVRSGDVIMLAYRRSALERFRRLLNDEAFFAQEQKRTADSPERVWQRFFEANKWIFGYGLFFVFSTALNDRKLEQIVAGATVAESGKVADALLRTRGRISSLCFVEIKTHKTSLLTKGSFRSGVWAPSHELVSAVSQAQRTVYGAEKDIRRRLQRTDRDGNPTGEEAFLVRPRSIAVVGSLQEFKAAHGDSEARFTCFELFRRQVQSPEIITFDELYERAKYITESEAEEAAQV